MFVADNRLQRYRFLEFVLVALPVFIINDNTKVGLRNRQEYVFGNIGEDRCGNR